MTIDDSLNAHYAELDLAIQNAEKNPDGVYLAFERFNSSGGGDREQTALFLAAYFDHPDPVVQFGVHRTMGDVVCWAKNDPAGLEHYDRAIAAIDAAQKRLTVYYASGAMNDVYRLKVIACEHCRRPEEAKKTALDGTRHFMEAGPCDYSAAWLYHYCVTQVLGPGQEKESLRICDAFIAGMNGPHRFISDKTARVRGKREELVATLDGRPVPDLGGLRLASGTGPLEFHVGSERCMIMLGLAATDGRLWLASPQGPSMRWGTALWYRPDLDETQSVSSVTDPVCCVAATRDFAFFGGLRDGLYKLDRDGRLLKHYRRNDGAFPIERIVDLCAGGGKIYVCYSNGSRDGVAVVDPATDNLTVLASSTREAQPQSEPVADVLRVWWDAATPRLYASSHDRSHWYYPPLLCQYAWTPDGKTWERLTGEEAPRSVVSQGDEALVVRVRGKQVEFRFPRTGQTVEAEVPLPSLMGDPAWDEHRIWVPSAAGLYEIDRGTARITWLAYQNDTLFFSALKHAGRLYVATSRGLYYREIP